MKNFEEFCGSTSLHAWNRLPPFLNPVRKVYWILVICGSLLLAAFFVYENVDEFMKVHSTTTIETSTGPISDGKFPKISICNSYNVRQSFMDTIFDQSVVTDDDSGYDIDELQETFQKYFIKGYQDEEGEKLKEKIAVVKEKYVDTDHFNETLVRECPNDPNDYDYMQCTFEMNVMERRTDLQLTVSQSLLSMVLQYKVQDTTYYGGSGGWNAGYEETDIGDCFTVSPYYIGPVNYSNPDSDSEGENPDLEEEYYPQTLSGLPFGVDILLDAEAFDNGDLQEPFDGFKIAVTAQGDYALFGLNAFSVGVGTIAMISNKISLYKTTDVVLSRFSSDKRKCIDASDKYDIYI